MSILSLSVGHPNIHCSCSSCFSQPTGISLPSDYSSYYGKAFHSIKKCLLSVQRIFWDYKKMKRISSFPQNAGTLMGRKDTNISNLILFNEICWASISPPRDQILIFPVYQPTE